MMTYSYSPGPAPGKRPALSSTHYLIFVASLKPNQILATTFTRKAATELRSRILGWGYRKIDAADSTRLSNSARQWLKAIDLDEIITDTLDAVCEAVMREHRGYGRRTPGACR
jgi:DNA helicase-2/ATP-dependent DNA helicase PcrA